MMIVLGSCKKRDKVPDGYPNRHEMALILADLLVAESTMSNDHDYYKYREQRSGGFYKYVLSKHNLSKEQFDTILNWYSLHPKTYQEVYDEVIAILTERDVKLRSDISKPDALEMDLTELPQQVELWSDSVSFNLPLDSVDQQIPFTFKTDSLRDGILRLSAQYTFKKEDVGLKYEMMMVVALSDGKQDTVKVEIPKSFTRKISLLTYDIASPASVTSVSGFLLLSNSKKRPGVLIEDVKLQFYNNQAKGILEE
jgi:hypothetical protein